jgi:CheY-like chemotaxis protein
VAISVLIVDDYVAFRRSVRARLEAEGLPVVASAATCAAGLTRRSWRLRSSLTARTGSASRPPVTHSNIHR